MPVKIAELFRNAIPHRNETSEHKLLGASYAPRFIISILNIAVRAKSMLTKAYPYQLIL